MHQWIKPNDSLPWVTSPGATSSQVILFIKQITTSGDVIVFYTLIAVTIYAVKSWRRIKTLM